MSDQYFYYAEQNASPLAVTVQSSQSTIEIRHESGESITTWQVKDVVSVDEDRQENLLWLANNAFPHARLVVQGEEACNAIWTLLQTNPKPRPANWGKRFGIAIPALVVFFVLFGFFGPSMNSVILYMVPESFDKALGNWAVEAVSNDWQFCQEPKAEAALEKIVKRLEQATQTNFDFHVRVVKDYDVNALAAPGGNIVILSGLLNTAESAEEVAGVLAHEMAHVTERHGTASLVKQLFLSFLFAIAGSDRHGVGHELVAMHMSRGQERDADQKGSRLLARAKISVAGLRAFFERLAKKDEKTRVLSFLHSHPDSAERAQSLMDPTNLQTQPLLNKKEWQALKDYCKDTPGAS